MTDDSHPGTKGDGPEDEKLLNMLATALTEDGELLPTTEDEVARVEEELERAELPASLEKVSFDEGAAEVTDLGDYRRTREEVRSRISPWTHGVALMIGAAAALAIKVGVVGTDPSNPSMSSDPAGVPTSSAPTPEREITLQTSCEGCCGGAACDAAKTGLEKCPSGRACIPCNAAVLADSRYRVRVSAVAPAPLGVEVLEKFPQGEPELCVRAGVSKELCVPTLVSDREGGRWARLPAVFSGADLAAKLRVRLRWKGVREPLATAGTWTMPLALTPKSLCSGYQVELRERDKEELFGTLSLFVDDAHHVEIARAKGTAPLRDLRERMVLKGVGVQLFETQGEGERKFVLTTGPFGRQTATALRWQLLEQDVSATVGVGLDYVGEPLPLP